LGDDGSVTPAQPKRAAFLLPSLQGYRLAKATPDLLAGVTLLVIAVPEQLATSRLAGMPPITGFYAFIAGTVFFALLGSNPQLSVGADSTIAPLFAVGIAHLAPTGSADYVALVGMLAVMVGTIVALIGILRLGWIAEFLSAPIITGFMAGVAVIIVIHQLPDFFGLSSISGTNLQRVSEVASHLGQTNGWTVGIGVGVLAVVVVAERINRKVPGALVGLIGSAAVVGALGLTAHGVGVVGTVAHGAPHLGLHGLSWTALGSVAPIAAVVALVVVTQTAATTRAFADQGHYEVNVARDFIGVGAGSIAAGLIGSFPVNASPARTGAIASAGGRTQAAGLGAAAAVVLIIPAAGLLKDVPLATLAAVLMYIATRIFKLKDLVAIAKFDSFEFALAIITLLTVALVGVEQGIAVAVALAIGDRTRLSARAHLHVLGRMPGSTSWAPLNEVKEAVAMPAVLVALFSSPVWYANAEHFQDAVDEALASQTTPPQVFVLDTIGMNDIDFTGCRVLGEVLDKFEAEHIVFAIARAGDRLRDSLDKAGLMTRMGPDHCFAFVDEAVTALSPK
jgi:SulP family sulfate permease